MRRQPLRITKGPRRHPGPSSISYFTLDAGTRSLFSARSCIVRCRSCCCCHCKKWRSLRRQKSGVDVPASGLRKAPPLARVSARLLRPGSDVKKRPWRCYAGATGRSRARYPRWSGSYYILLLSRQGLDDECCGDSCFKYRGSHLYIYIYIFFFFFCTQADRISSPVPPSGPTVQSQSGDNAGHLLSW